MKGTVSTNQKVELEYQVNTSPGVLFKRLSTPHGLSEWFANDVNLSGNVFTFIWDGDTKKAELVDKKENKFVKFRWITEQNEAGHHFAFKLTKDELTGEVSLTVIEEVNEEEDIDEVVSLWNYQIGELKRLIGA
ncbi:MAG: START-like domain-containing protein [Tenuifilum sp.]|uniref:START-like domain-containing protein n=1 Tax=Tenuifilum sp. TaxID=2760880 RepID=UPI001B6ED9B7|nr:SRPBCC domain-containing protein [Bacteroidales bacterium]HOK61313.1 START-like domain-containing protein [Tenuifilum sp.]MBP9028787.1 SRPBCC domain-containing protein [Bacteroidales bacterium]HOK85934.1 START-like domain-containing protein [Tenuifilum sp.]HON70801.1 START-like domain-containing protein [Tenuifilum sp.]